MLYLEIAMILAFVFTLGIGCGIGLTLGAWRRGWLR